MTRTGKIARLPLAIRDELNRRLADGEPGGSLLPWLNSLPAARTVLECQFGGAAITKQNLSEWRKGGFLEWRARQELLTDAHQFSAGTRELREASGGRLTDDLSTVLAAEYAMVLSDWNGKGDETLEARLKVLHGLSQAIGTLRHGEHKIERLKFGREKLAFAREKAGMETMLPMEELPCDPAVRDLVGEDLAGAGEGEITMEELLDPVVGVADVAGPSETPQSNAVAAIAAEADGAAEAGGVRPSPTWSNKNFFRGTGGNAAIERAASSAGLPTGGGRHFEVELAGETRRPPALAENLAGRSCVRERGPHHGRTMSAPVNLAGSRPAKNIAGRSSPAGLAAASSVIWPAGRRVTLPPPPQSLARCLSGAWAGEEKSR